MADVSIAAFAAIDMLLFPAEIARALAPDGVLPWINQLGQDGPLYLPTEEVAAALPGLWTAVEAEAGWGNWAYCDAPTNYDTFTAGPGALIGAAPESWGCPTIVLAVRDSVRSPSPEGPASARFVGLRPLLSLPEGLHRAAHQPVSAALGIKDPRTGSLTTPR